MGEGLFAGVGERHGDVDIGTGLGLEPVKSACAVLPVWIATAPALGSAEGKESTWPRPHRR